MKIGFIGTGIVGLPMAGHLLAAGHDLQVTRAAIERLQALMDQDLSKLGTQAVFMTFGSN